MDINNGSSIPKKTITAALDMLIACIFAVLLVIVIGGGFSFTLLGVQVHAHNTENPPIIFVFLVILRKLVAFHEVFGELPVVKRVGSVIKEVRKRVSHIHPLTLLCAIVGVYIIVMSLVSIRRHLAYYSHAFDLGIFDQIIWNISQGNGPISFILGGRHFFGEHLSPILFLLAPFYHIYESRTTLLVIQSIALSLGAFPIYTIAFRSLKSKQLALIFSAVYLCYQPLRNVNLYDFHPIAFATPLLLFAFYFVEQRRYVLFGLFLLLAALCKEEIATIIFIFGIYIAFIQKQRKIGIALSIAGMAIFVLDIFVIIPHYRQASFGFVSRYSYLGDSIPEILKTLISRPFYVLRHLITGKKILHVIDVFGPLGFLSIFSPSHLLLTVPTFLQNILSGSAVQYSLGFQYTSPLTPFVFISAIYGVRNLLTLSTLRQRLRFTFDRAQAIQGISILLIMLCLLFFGRSPMYRMRQYTRTTHTKLADTIIEQIPASASVSAQGTLVPHLSHREHIYQFPTINDAEYILLDTTANKWPLKDAEYEEKLALLPQRGYSILNSSDGIVLFKK